MDNGAAVLGLANTLKRSGAEHALHVFVSSRKFCAEFSPSVLHTDENGELVKSDAGKPQFRISDTPDLSSYRVVPSIVPFIKEMDFEHKVHNEYDMHTLHLMECEVIKRQLIRAGIGPIRHHRSFFSKTSTY